MLNVLTHDRFSHCLLPNLRLNFDFGTMISFSISHFQTDWDLCVCMFAK